MSQVSAVLELPYIQAAQAQKHVTHNEALQTLDVAVQLAVSSRTQATPPADPVPGTRHVVPVGAVDDWAGQQRRIALFDDGTWVFHDPLPGWRAHVLDEGVLVVFDGDEWVQPGLGLAVADRLGINTTADAVNRLAVSAAATLLSHQGAGHQLKVNKAAANQTASLLFQSEFSGRAEMGLAGDDDFSVKVSPNGTAWTTALQTDRTTGIVTAPAGLNAATLTLAGSQVIARSNLLGMVNQSGGVPTGAVIQRGSNSNGEFVRFADGTQICQHALTIGTSLTASGSIFLSDQSAWTFPAVFSATPSVTGGRTGSATAPFWLCQGNSGVSGSVANLRVLGTASFGSGIVMSVFAYGRWF